MAAINFFLPRLSKARGISRARQDGFVHLGMNLARWGKKKKSFTYRDLFAGSLPGVHYETYNPDSLLTRRNLLTASESFDSSAWTKVGGGITVTANATIAPDGTLSADKLVGASTATNKEMFFATGVPIAVGEPCTASVHLKQAEYSWAYVCCNVDASTNGWFINLATGAVGNSFGAAPGVVTVTPADNGFWRIAVTKVATIATGYLEVFLSTVNGATVPGFAGDNVSGIYAWGAQFERRAAAPSTYQKVTDWNTEYLAAAGSRVHLWQDNLRTVPVTAVEQTVGCWDDLSPNAKHATQGTAGSRPKLSARYNLLTKTEQVDDASWTKSGGGTGVAPVVTANAGIDPLGGQTADRVVFSRGAGATAADFSYIITPSGTSVSGAPYTSGTYLKSNNGATQNVLVYVVTASAVQLIVAAVGPAWTLVRPANLTATSATINMVIGSIGGGATSGGDSNLDLLVWGADVRQTSDAALAIPAYQRVNTATDYDTANFIHYLKFDGIDDSFVTPAIDFSGVNKLTVWAALTKLSDGATAILAELTASASANDGAFYLGAPDSAGVAALAFALRGTVQVNGQRFTPYAAPISAVFVGQLDPAGATAAAQIGARISGAQLGAGVQTSAGATSAGNFANAALNIGRRNSASAPFNGRLTSFTVRGSTTPASVAFIKSMEQYAAKLAGQTFVSS